MPNVHDSLASEVLAFDRLVLIRMARTWAAMLTLLALSDLQVGLASQAFAQGASTAAPAARIAPSGLPIPRFVSLKSDLVNMRSGPGTDYPTQWVFKRAGLPVEVLREFEGWRQVRDAEGATGWVLASLLSGRRTALVLPWEAKGGKTPPQIAIKNDNSDSAADVAKVEAGVLANIRNCDGRWCELSIAEVRGYIEQKKLWGVYPGEIVKP